MNLSHGWSANPTVLLAHRIVAALHSEPPTAAHPATVTLLARTTHSDPDAVQAAAALLVEQGRAEVRPGQMELFNLVSLTALGVADAGGWTADRADDGRRLTACRAAILDWLDDQDAEWAQWNFQNDPRANFYGDPFTDAEVRGAIRTLQGRGLIDADSSAEGHLLLVKVEEDGRDCLNRFSGNVDDWFDRNTTRAGDTYTSNVYDSPGSNVMAGSPGGQQSSTVTITNIGRQQLVTVADQIIENLAALEFDGLSRAEAKTAAVELRALADQPNADRNRAKALLGVIATSAAGAVGSGGGQALMHLISRGVQAIGS